MGKWGLGMRILEALVGSEPFCVTPKSGHAWARNGDILFCLLTWRPVTGRSSPRSKSHSCNYRRRGLTPAVLFEQPGNWQDPQQESSWKLPRRDSVDDRLWRFTCTP
ncbi:hypothetical protein VTI74DRAFT_2858 [Chaetomium olivicolor]